MNHLPINKKKIINDPVFGFITLQSETVYDLLEHPYFQRLRRIKQLGLSYLVFPGANHTRFEHALGTVHLMRQAISVLRAKGTKISSQEAEAVTIAILLHDIGHSPFSHVLEKSLVNAHHEEVSALIMEELDKQFSGKLKLAIQIFKNQYKKKFLHQLVSSQLDMDRLDYLSRDSFFTGVAEGVVSIDRIIKMFDVWNDNLVVEVKGIYSIEKFLIARRLMYWQVYLHKTVVSAEYLLVSIFNRARQLIKEGKQLFTPPSLEIFFKNNITFEDFKSGKLFEGRTILDHFMSVDDDDLMVSIKAWQNHPDKVLALLASNLITRKLFGIRLNDKPFSKTEIKILLTRVQEKYGISANESHYFCFTDKLSNNAYSKDSQDIKILFKDGKILDISKASDINLLSLTKTVNKYFLCYPKELDI